MTHTRYSIRFLAVAISILITSAFFSPSVEAIVVTNNGVSWKEIIIPPKTGPCYVSSNEDYGEKLWSIGNVALHGSGVQLSKSLTSMALGSAQATSKGCVTFPYLGNPYDIDGTLKVFNWVHAGVDLRADVGDSIYALNGGTVVWTNLCSAGTTKKDTSQPFCKSPTEDGNPHSTLIIEDFDKTRKTFYLHMSKFSSMLSIGQQVCKGQYIGKAGNVGTIEAHLHIEVWPSSAPRYATQTNALSGSQCPGKKPYKLADGSTRSAYCDAADVSKYTIDPVSIKTTGWRTLRLGQSGNEIEFRRVKNDAVTLFRGMPIATCVAGSNFVGDRAAYLNDELSISRVVVSPISPTGKYLAVFCADSDGVAYSLRIVDRSHLLVVHTISPSPPNLFVPLHAWISFSPNDHFAILNQTGDEGNYAPLLLHLDSGVGKTFDAPLVNDEGCPAKWTSPQTYTYRATQVCDAFDNPNDPMSACTSLGIYEFNIDLPSGRVRKERITDWDSY